MRTPDQYQPYSAVRAYRLLTITIGVMALGTVAELLLLEHYEDQWQLVPIVLIGISIVILIFSKWNSSKLLVRIFKGLMLACAISGLLGTWFHLKANLEFEKELHPSATGWQLVMDSLTGALPALAPGSMIVFSLVGYLYTLLIIKKTK